MIMVRRNDMKIGVDDDVMLTQSLQGKGSALMVSFRWIFAHHYVSSTILMENFV